MSETFRCDDKQMLVAYLYGEIDGDGSREVERHLRTCAACTNEAAALQALRVDLQAWTPPDVELGFTVGQSPAVTSFPGRSRSLLPIWAQVAAAVLVVAVGAAIANVQVRYDSGGLMLTTGWMTPPASVSAPAAAPAPAAPAADWRPALVALEQSLRDEMATMRRTGADAAPMRAAAAPSDNPELLRRIQSLIDESEQRQRQELALRLTQVRREVDMNRQADLVRIDRSFGTLQGRTFKTAADQQEVVNYLRRVAAQPIP